MISVSGKQWKQKEIDRNKIEKVRQDNDFSEIISKLIVSRNFNDEEISLINHDIDLKNVFSNNNDFKEAVDLVSKVIKDREKIYVLGDYDVDGSVATSLFIRFFESLNHPFAYYIPDREKDGYGATEKLFKKLILEKPKLIIMVDCGSTSNKAIDFLNKNKIKSLIIDHHEINKPFPKAKVIINPKKNIGYEEYDYLCAATLSYFFLDLLIKKIKCKVKISDYLIYVLLATVCDVMPLRKLNRLIAKKSLNNFDISKNMPLNIIFNLNNKKNKININDLGYLVGPILNAGGRLGKSNYAAELLSSNSSKIVTQRSINLMNLNHKRKELEKFMLSEIDFKKIEEENKNLILYYSTNIHEGLIGIIASRLKDFFNRPAIVITNSNNILKGSARSINDYNIGRVIKKTLDQKIILSGGGHNMAGGFILEKNKLTNFKDFIFEDFLKFGRTNNLFLYESEISAHALNQNFYDDLKKLEPFGNGNLSPTFLIKNLKIIKRTILDNKHISLILKSSTGYSIKSISFNSINTKVGDYLINYKDYFNVLGHINENIWNNKKSLQLTISDIVI